MTGGRGAITGEAKRSVDRTAVRPATNAFREDVVRHRPFTVMSAASLVVCLNYIFTP